MLLEEKPPNNQTWNYFTSQGMVLVVAVVTIWIAQAFVSSCKMRMKKDESVINFEVKDLGGQTP